jgi:hypothetical protein
LAEGRENVKDVEDYDILQETTKMQ